MAGLCYNRDQPHTQRPSVVVIGKVERGMGVLDHQEVGQKEPQNHKEQRRRPLDALRIRAV